MKKILFVFTLLLAVVLSGCTFNFSINTNWGNTPTPAPTSTLEADNKAPHTFEIVSVTQEELVGQWTIDAVYTEEFTGKSLQEMYGSAFGIAGCGMEFGDDDSFSYDIAIRIGGEGSYAVSEKDKYIHVELTEFESEETSQFSIWAVFIDGNLRLMMDQGGELILWMRKADVL